ncbi:MAG: YcjF family protein [Verrucomicrobia bacterium]|nr:YcjF family protein [Verrucomicrobiota bacterium]
MTTAAAAISTITLVEPGVRPDPERNAAALSIVKKWSLWAMAPGILPYPFLDLVAIGAIQMNMLREISNLYGTKFSANLVKNIVGSVLGSFGMAVAGTGFAYSLLKALPVAGRAAGVLALPVVAGASTYALGRVFILHFASGGTFLTFDPNKVRDFFQQTYEEGVQEMQKKAQDKKDAHA